MKLLFDFDIDKNKIVFFGNGFEISSPAETYEDIAEFAEDVIENYIGIPNLKHRKSGYCFAPLREEPQNECPTLRESLQRLSTGFLR